MGCMPNITSFMITDDGSRAGDVGREPSGSQVNFIGVDRRFDPAAKSGSLRALSGSYHLDVKRGSENGGSEGFGNRNGKDIIFNSIYSLRIKRR
ncbi:unnamed protein product [Cuscuta epithymum]|uniref:Uncharacterized protein n=1 Tax=Cuscuta epithymum TaxID=186058 RepID=A0AAV0EKB2_9ASTE|nr:unnamed protein product [Cuscuta epithymum]